MKATHLSILGVCLVILLSACGTPAVQTVVVRETVAAAAKSTAGVNNNEVRSTQVVSGQASSDLAFEIPLQANRMVIKDAEMEILVRDTNAALDQVTQLAMDYGGYIISSQTRLNGNYAIPQKSLLA